MNIGFTIATINYLPHVKTLGDSLKAYHPDISFYICLVGDKNDIADLSCLSAYTVIDISSIAQNIGDMRSRYNDFELCCALKPFFAEYLFNNYPIETMLYFDSDILIFNSMQLVLEALQTKSIVITPHCTSIQNRQDNHQMDLALLNYGVFNAGFFGLRRSGTSAAFINWWKDKMRTECYKDLPNGRYVDQIWLNLVPVYFDDVLIFKDKGYNMAVWNLDERVLIPLNDSFSVNDHSTPLVFFHFSGYDLKQPAVLSKNHPIHSFESRPDVIPVFEAYKNGLGKNLQIMHSVNDIGSSGEAKKEKAAKKSIGNWMRKLLLLSKSLA